MSESDRPWQFDKSNVIFDGHTIVSVFLVLDTIHWGLPYMSVVRSNSIYRAKNKYKISRLVPINATEIYSV